MSERGMELHAVLSALETLPPSELTHAAFVREATRRLDEVLLGHATATAAFEVSLRKATQSLREFGDSVAALRDQARFGNPGPFLELAAEIDGMPPSYFEPDPDPRHRKPRGLRRHIRRLKAETRRKG